MPVNDLDLLSDVTALHEETLEFLVSATNLTGALTFTLNRSSPTAQLVKGDLSLTPYGPGTALFRYTPSPEDVVGFDLTITARDAQGNEREAEFTVAPFPVLPAEESFIKSVIPAPDPESGDYLTQTDVASPESPPWNGHDSSRAVSISAKTLILAAGHPNKILESYSQQNQNIKTFDLYAERVVLRNPMYLQGATVTIYARELVYENGATFVDVKQVNHVSGPITWLQPETLRIILAYARDLYISGRGPETRAILTHYQAFLEGMAASSAWAQYSEEAQNEFDQMHGEMTTMLWNLDRNFDYFGNPAGWVPNLSFEVNLGFFNSEIRDAIGTMYLSYWLGHVANSVEARVAAMTSSRVTLHEEIIAMEVEMDTLRNRLPELTNRVAKLGAELEDLQNQVKQREEELQREYEKAKKKNKWRTVAKRVGGIMQVVPVFQPALAAVGAGMSAVANLDKNSGLADWKNALGAVGGIVGEFKKTDFGASWDSITDYTKNTLKTLDPRQIKEGGMVAYYKKVQTFGKDLQKQTKPIVDKLKKIEADDKVLQALLAEAKSQAPEFNPQVRTSDGRLNGLLDEITRKTAEQRDLSNEITEAVRKMGQLTDTIHRNVLGMDALSQDIAQNNGALNLRAITYLKDMDKRAKERLLKYQYYMAKAYEYRLLQPYEGDLNLGTLFDKLVKLAEADSNGNGKLSESQFTQLSKIYTEQVAEITRQIVERFNETSRSSEFSISHQLDAGQLQALNEGEPVQLDFVELRRVPQAREDLQMNDLQIMMTVAGAPEPNELFSLLVDHSGESRLKLGSDLFLFRHSNTSAQNPFQRDHPFHWEAEYNSNTREVTERRPSKGDLALIRFLLEARGVSPTDANLALFSRAGLWSALTLRRRDNNPATLSRYRIGDVTITVNYDFRDQPSSMVALDVFTANDGVWPLIKVGAADLAKRKDGLRRFHRTYGRPPAGPVKLTAPEVFGSWQFERWTDGFFAELGRQPALDVLLDGNKRVMVHYRNTDTDADSMPDARELAWFGTLIQGTEDDPDADGLNNFAETVYGTNPSLLDSDDDGFDDRFEFQAGSDPTSAHVLPLHLRDIEDLGAGLIRLSWTSEPGGIYGVEAMPELGRPQWEEVVRVRAASAVSQSTLQTLGNPAFFRIGYHGFPPVLPPRILVQPQDQTVTESSRASLSVVVTGTEPMQIQWYSGASQESSVPIVRAQGRQYSPPPLATGAFWARIWNSAGQTDTRSATVSVDFGAPQMILAAWMLNSATSVVGQDIAPDFGHPTFQVARLQFANGRLDAHSPPGTAVQLPEFSVTIPAGDALGWSEIETDGGNDADLLITLPPTLGFGIDGIRFNYRAHNAPSYDVAVVVASRPDKQYVIYNNHALDPSGVSWQSTSADLTRGKILQNLDQWSTLRVDDFDREPGVGFLYLDNIIIIGHQNR